MLDAIPEDRLLLETDSPNFGKDFKGMRDFAERLGKVIGRSCDELIAVVEENVGRLFQ